MTGSFTTLTPFTFQYQSDDNGGLVITGYSGTPPAALTIPSTINGQPVTSIGYHAFQYCYLTSVTFATPCNLSSIGANAFFNCDSLTGIDIPGSVTSIGDYAFSSCYALTGVTFATPCNISSIGNSAFDYRTGLTSVTIPSSVTSIGSSHLPVLRPD